jgi:hypothetical protein
LSKKRLQRMAEAILLWVFVSFTHPASSAETVTGKVLGPDANPRTKLTRLLSSTSSSTTHSATASRDSHIGRADTATSDALAVATRSRFIEVYGTLPLRFEANRGQTDQSVRFFSRGPGYRIFLTPGEAILSLDRFPSRENPRASGERGPQSTVLRTKFVGANSKPAISGDKLLASKSNYFIGVEPARHLTDIENFARVRYAQLYPGIDLIFYGNPSRLEYDFVVAPGADSRKIQFEITGADGLSVDAQGDLVLRTKFGDIRQHRPTVYQEVDGVHEPVDGRYVLFGNGRVGFQVAAYDTSRTLVIDPVLSYSTYLGGKASDTGMAVAVDATGNAYLTGYTTSSNFPLLHPYDRSLGNGDTDIFVTKLNATGTALVYSTYLGGRNGVDRAFGIAVDDAGNAYVTGTTSGSDFPVSTNAYQNGVSGGGSVVAKLGAAGDTLAYSTYVLNATVRGIALDGNGSAYVTGSATSAFLATTGAFQTSSNSASGTNAFVLKLNVDASAPVYATFLGGSGSDTGTSIGVDASGNAYVAGSTNSTDFPLANAFQPAALGGVDGFVAKIGPAGNALVFSTYLGGALDDSVNAIAVDQTGGAYVAGETYSSNFPVKNAFQPVKAGHLLTNASTGNAFVARFFPAGDDIAYSSFLGGEVCTSPCQAVFGVSEIRGDVVYGIAVDSLGHAYVTGLAKSYTFPLVDSLQGHKQQDNQDSLFVTKVAMTGNALLYSTLIRTGYSVSGSAPNGVPNGAGKSIAVDTSGGAFVISESDNFNTFPTTAGAYQTVLAGILNAVAFKLSTDPVTVTLASSANPVDSPSSVTLTAAVSGGGLAGNVTFMDGSGQLGTVAVTNGVATLTTILSKGIHALTAVFRGSGTAGDSPLLYQVVDNPLACN